MGKKRPDLLIVPYGIETLKTAKQTDYGPYLLIVPYGIETSQKAARVELLLAFNRTLWN